MVTLHDSWRPCLLDFNQSVYGGECSLILWQEPLFFGFSGTSLQTVIFKNQPLTYTTKAHFSSLMMGYDLDATESDDTSIVGH